MYISTCVHLYILKALLNAYAIYLPGFQIFSLILHFMSLLIPKVDQGCKIPLARSHWRVNIGGGRVKLAMRSPDRASVFSSSEFVIFQSFGRKNGKTPTTFLKSIPVSIPVAGITFLFVNIIHSGTPSNSTGH